MLNNKKSVSAALYYIKFFCYFCQKINIKYTIFPSKRRTFKRRKGSVRCGVFRLEFSLIVLVFGCRKGFLSPVCRYDSSVELICPRKDVFLWWAVIASNVLWKTLLINLAKPCKTYREAGIHWLHDISVLKLIIGRRESLLHWRKF